MSADTRENSSPLPALRVQNLGKCYHIYGRPQDRLKQALLRWRRTYYREFWALRGVSFEVGRGEAVGIVGRNGSGKSTLLQMIAGTLAPTEGRVELAGRVAALLELGSGFNPEFTGRENVYLNGAILGLSAREMDERVGAIAAFADIGDFLDQPVKTYSSGMMVRLAFAVQVQVEPDILIVDEALAVGDSLFQKRCYQRLEELRAKGVTLLFVSHDQESVRTLTSRAILLHEGRVLSSGSSAQVLLDYRRLLHEEEKRWYAGCIGAAKARAVAPPVNGSPAATPPEPAPAAPTAPDPAPVGARSGALSFGDLDAEVVSVAILDGAGRTAAVFWPGDPVHVRVSCRMNRDLEHLAVSLRIRNKQGVKICSWGTLNQDNAVWSRSPLAAGAGCVVPGRPEASSPPGDDGVFWTRCFRAGETVDVDFFFECRLGMDFYEVQAAITHEANCHFGSQRTLHWRDEAAFFQVLVQRQEYFFGGTCDLRMKAVVQSAAVPELVSTPTH